MTKPGSPGIDLYWLPLGSGGFFLRPGGILLEAIAARRRARPRFDLYHAALEARTEEATYVVELLPYVWGSRARRNDGVAASGPVVLRAAGRLPLFRYEVRRWRDGRLMDADYAVESPVPVSRDSSVARRLLRLVPEIPIGTWGRDEFGVGEIWTSNSVVSWLLARAEADAAALRPPTGGRAPGWTAGLRLAELTGEAR